MRAFKALERRIKLDKRCIVIGYLLGFVQAVLGSQRMLCRLLALCLTVRQLHLSDDWSTEITQVFWYARIIVGERPAWIVKKL